MQAAPIKAVLFDLDDTLWSIVPVIRRAETVLHQWLATHAPGVANHFDAQQMRALRDEVLATDPAYQIDMWGLRNATLTRAFHAANEDVALVQGAMAVFSRARNAVMPFSDVQPTLTSLAARVKLGSISNGAADLEEIGLAHHFHYSIAAHQSGCAKPDPGIFRRACEALEVLPSEAVYVGDDPHLDVEGAQKAGLLGVWMNHAELGSTRQMPAHIQPDAVCRSLLELDVWLQSRI